MDSGSGFETADPRPGANGAAAVDPNTYRDPGPAPGDVGGEATAAAEARPIPHGMVAAMVARLGSFGIADPERVREFEQAYREELEQLFGWLDLSDALAEYGITLGDGAPMPPWMRVAGAAGGAGVLLLMRRPELVGRMSAAMRGASRSRREAASDGDDDDDASVVPGGGPGAAAGEPEGVGHE